MEADRDRRPTLVPMIPPSSSSPLPLAAYQPSSLFAMLLVSSLLPRNTFSLRWLALSGVGVGGAMGANHGECGGGWGGGGGIGGHPRAVARRGGGSGWKLHPGGWRDGDGVAVPSSSLALSWRDIVAALGGTVNANANCDRSSSLVIGTDDGSWDLSVVDSILGKVPRGGGGDRGGGERDGTYAGLVNIGNTCYLNAQLQCAYHIPYLRRLVLDAKDEIVRVEVEVEIETDDDDLAITVRGDNSTLDCPDAKPDEGTMTESAAASANDHLTELENIVDSLSAVDYSNNTAGRPIEAKKSVIVKKMIKEEILTVSPALRALKVTFNSLDGSMSSSGTTKVLCQTLGINPYIQQDGQEFWKLFIPEIRNDQLERLYSGYFEDYVREILPAGDESAGEDLATAVEDYGEEKKDEDDTIAFSTERVKTNQARERIRKEVFLDLSIPVSEGVG